MRKQNIVFVLLVAIALNTKAIYAQIDFNQKPDDDLGNVEDAFQENFFEALKQEGIENYERAIEALKKCVALNTTEPAIYFQLGKNYTQIKHYEEAKTNLKKAVTINPNNEWYLKALYDVYALQNDYQNAISTIKKLIPFHHDYKENLATLYLKTNQPEKALQLIDELDEEYGYSATRDKVRDIIYQKTGKKEERIENLEKRLTKNPENEKNYLALIYRYSENNELDKAFETAKKLQETNPDSDLAHLALYKFYLEKDLPEKAIKSMQIVLNSSQIEAPAKTLVLQDFVRFVSKNPSYEKQLLEITNTLNPTQNSKTNIEIAQYYLTQNDKQSALTYYEKALQKEPTNFNVVSNVLLLYIDFNKNEEALQKSKEALEIFPAQPLLYLLNGVANNKTGNPKQAIEVLETGIDFIIDDTKMKADFYQQLSIAYTQLNNPEKASYYKEKVNQLDLKN